jgi:hypothetical protein
MISFVFDAGQERLQTFNHKGRAKRKEFYFAGKQELQTEEPNVKKRWARVNSAESRFG